MIKNLINPNKYSIKCPYDMSPVGICVHNTANDASAQNEIAYMCSNNNEVSFHIAIDDKEAIQAIPFNKNTWHAGDSENGLGNRNYISIEICYSKSGGEKFINAEKRAAKEIALLLKEFNWSINEIRKHEDFSGKYCPHRTLDLGWNRFLSLIELELNQTTSSNINISTDKELKRYAESGKCTITVDSINFRSKPYVGNDNPVQGQYYKNEFVYYDLVVITECYVWISWIGSSGTRRYMPITDRKTSTKWAYCT